MQMRMKSTMYSKYMRDESAEIHFIPFWTSHAKIVVKVVEVYVRCTS
jgi:hypothetical protein